MEEKKRMYCIFNRAAIIRLPLREQNLKLALTLINIIGLLNLKVRNISI